MTCDAIYTPVRRQFLVALGIVFLLQDFNYHIFASLNADLSYVECLGCTWLDKTGALSKLYICNNDYFIVIAATLSHGGSIDLF